MFEARVPALRLT